MFTKTRHLDLTYISYIMSDDLLIYITNYYTAAVIKPSCKYLERVLAKRPFVN